MAEPLSLKDPWLVAAWPGMGSVALASATYLVSKLGGREVESFVKPEYFDLSSVAIENGVVRRPSQPKNTLYAISGLQAPHDMLVFVGEAQPSQKGYEFCHELIDLALARGTRRIVTFAAMATPVPPNAEPRVFGVASESGLLPLLVRHQVGVLKEGQISGLNGVLLAAAAERGVEALCLLGELPIFLMNAEYPKASLAVLRAFSRIAETRVDLGELEEKAEAVERHLTQLLERATKAAEAAQQQGEEEKSSIPQPEPEPEGPPPAVLQRIEELFRLAKQDKSAAIVLKAELDKHGLFKRFEDRFLDLFKKGEHG